MRHVEKVSAVTAAVAALATIACCLPVGFAAAAVTASLAMAVAAYRPWFLGASVLLLIVAAVQIRRTQKACKRRPTSSLIVFGLSAIIVALVVLLPDVTAGTRAGWFTPGEAPHGQPPLVTMDAAALETLKADFNRAASGTRAIILLSPT